MVYTVFIVANVVSMYDQNQLYKANAETGRNLYSILFLQFIIQIVYASQLFFTSMPLCNLS